MLVCTACLLHFSICFDHVFLHYFLMISFLVFSFFWLMNKYCWSHFTIFCNIKDECCFLESLYVRIIVTHEFASSKYKIHAAPCGLGLSPVSCQFLTHACFIMYARAVQNVYTCEIVPLLFQLVFSISCLLLQLAEALYEYGKGENEKSLDLLGLQFEATEYKVLVEGGAMWGQLHLHVLMQLPFAR